MNWQKYNPPGEAADILTHCKRLSIASTTDELVDLACGGPQSIRFEVAYDVPGKGRVVEATVARVRNGIAANYLEPYMRRRDPDCMVIGDDLPTDKTRFQRPFRHGVRRRCGRRPSTGSRRQELAMFGFRRRRRRAWARTRW